MLRAQPGHTRASMCTMAHGGAGDAGRANGIRAPGEPVTFPIPAFPPTTAGRVDLARRRQWTVTVLATVLDPPPGKATLSSRVQVPAKGTSTP